MSGNDLVDQAAIEKTLGIALSGGASFAEVFVEDERRDSVGLDDGRIERLASGRDRGAGIRVMSGSSVGFAHTADLSPKGLARAAKAAAEAVGAGDGVTTTEVARVATTPGFIPAATSERTASILPC